jgi:hypothetical protein
MLVRCIFCIQLCIVSLESCAQGKLYIAPQLGFYSGSYRGVDSVNSKQTLFTTRKFQWKQLIYGIKFSYYNDNFEFSTGIENGNYASGFSYGGDNSRPDNITAGHSIAEGSNVIFGEFKHNLFSINIKLPKWLKRDKENEEKPYLIVSRIMPMLGFEHRWMPRVFINHFEEFSGVSTLQGNIPFAVSYNSYNSTHFSMRGGFDWVFYDGEKRKFIISLMYSFAFKDAGYFYYRFYHNTPQEFHYRDNTRGNGISLKIGIPVKLVEFGKNKKG